MSATPLFISLIYCLDTEQGHMLSYNACFGEACRMNEWEHTAAVRAAARVPELPQGWACNLGMSTEPRGPRPLRRWRKFASFVDTTADYLDRKVADGSRPIVLFLEWFDLIHLVTLVLALLRIPTPRLRNTSTWLNYRFAFENDMRLRATRLLLGMIERRMPGRVVICTETDLVAASHLQMLGRKAHILPMPNMVTAEEAWSKPDYTDSPERAGQIVCLWPGQATTDKGLERVHALTRATTPDARRLTIVADESAQFERLPEGCNVILLKKGLPRDLYIGWLRTVDVVLMPYSPDAYENRTSGIFGDAVSVGKPPVVTDGTWMARELRRFGLESLTIDWHAPNVPAILAGIVADAEIAKRLTVLTASYASFHSRHGYARVIRDIYLRADAPPIQP